MRYTAPQAVTLAAEIEKVMLAHPGSDVTLHPIEGIAITATAIIHCDMCQTRHTVRVSSKGESYKT